MGAGRDEAGAGQRVSGGGCQVLLDGGGPARRCSRIRIGPADRDLQCAGTRTRAVRLPETRDRPVIPAPAAGSGGPPTVTVRSGIRLYRRRRFAVPTRTGWAGADRTRRPAAAVRYRLLTGPALRRRRRRPVRTDPPARSCSRHSVRCASRHGHCGRPLPVPGWIGRRRHSPGCRPGWRGTRCGCDPGRRWVRSGGEPPACPGRIAPATPRAARRL